MMKERYNWNKIVLMNNINRIVSNQCGTIIIKQTDCYSISNKSLLS